MLRNDSVLTNSQQDYLHYHNDGLLDIFIGLALIVVGFGLLTDIPYIFAFSIPTVFLPAWREAKKKLTSPRMASLHFTDAQRLANRTKALLVGLLLAGILFFLAFAMAAMLWTTSRGLLPAWLLTLLREYFWLVLSAFGAGVLSLIAWLYQQSRFFAYSAFTLVTCVLISALNLPFWLVVTLTGTVMAGFGFLVFRRFIQTYPLERHT